MATKYVVEVKLDEDAPWIEMAVGRFQFRTVACYKMLELQIEHQGTDFEFRVTPVV